MNQSQDKLWITWEKHRRSRVLASYFDFNLIEVLSPRRGYKRYIESTWETSKKLFKIRPVVLVVQNPSMFLALLAVLLKPFLGYQLIVDRHTNFKFDKRKLKSIKWVLFRCISRFTVRFSDLTIVTNSGLARVVKKMGGKPFILQDKIPEISSTEVSTLNTLSPKKPYIFFVCSFGNDEPVEEFVKAYAKISTDVQLVISGNWARRFTNRDINEMPENVEFTGFISDESFESLMENSDGVVVLTKNEFTLNCGAYEALALSKPLLLSSTLALREYFGKVADFVRLDDELKIREDLSRFMLTLNDNLGEEKLKEIHRLKDDWRQRAVHFKKILKDF